MIFSGVLLSVLDLFCLFIMERTFDWCSTLININTFTSSR